MQANPGAALRQETTTKAHVQAGQTRRLGPKVGGRGRGCREGTILSPQDGGGVSEGGKEESWVPLGTQLSTQAAP